METEQAGLRVSGVRKLRDILHWNLQGFEYVWENSTQPKLYQWILNSILKTTCEV